MNILFITSNRLGDAVLSSGLVDHLVSRAADVRLTIACGPAPAPLFRAVPGCEQVIVLNKRRLGGHWLGLWRACVGRRWDLVVDLRGSALAWLLRARRRIVHRSTGEKVHRVVQNARLLGLDTPPAPRIWTDEAAREAADVVPPGPVLAVGPTANWGGKQWPAERFVDLIKRLTAPGAPFAGAAVMVLGGPGERELAAPVLTALQSVRLIDLVGTVDPLAAFACLERANLFVGNDSGLMHLAAAAGIPTLGLFGPSEEAYYAPWGPDCATVRGTQSFAEIVGAPGYDHRSDETRMTSLSVDRVERAVEELWARTRAKPQAHAAP